MSELTQNRTFLTFLALYFDQSIQQQIELTQSQDQLDLSTILTTGFTQFPSSAGILPSVAHLLDATKKMQVAHLVLAHLLFELG